VKARTLLLMCGLSLAGAAAADPLGAPSHSSDGWIFGRPSEGYDLPRKAPPSQPDAAVIPRPRKHAATIPLPRPRPDVPETTDTIEVEAPSPPPPAPTEPMPAPTLFAAPAPQDGAPGEPARALSTGAAVESAKDNDGAAMPPVRITDAGGGRIRIEAHEASLAQVLAGLQDSHLIQLSAAEAPPRTITGTYTGTLPQVLSRMLDGQNYFLRVTKSGTEFHAIDTSAGTNASDDTNAALRSGIVGSAAVASEPPPTPPPSFSLTPPNPVEPRTQVIPGPGARAAARARRRAH